MRRRSGTASEIATPIPTPGEAEAAARPPPRVRSGALHLRPLLLPDGVVHARGSSVVTAVRLRCPPEVDAVQEVDVAAERVLDRVHKLLAALAEALRDQGARL